MKYALKRLGLLLGAVALTVGIAETVVRIGDLAPELIRIDYGIYNSSYVRSADPLLGYELRPGAAFRGLDGSLVGRVNADGLWDVERETEKPAGTKRILLVGDSVAMSTDAGSLENSLSQILERTYTNRAVEVINLGVNGYCTRAEVRRLEQKGLRYDPDGVILLFVYNDYQDLNNDLVRVQFRRPAWTERLFLSSRLFRLLAMKGDWWEFSSQYAMANAVAEGPIREFTVEELKEVGALVEGNLLGRHQEAIGRNNVVAGLSRLKQLSEEHGFPVVVMVWPVFMDAAVVDVEGKDLNQLKIVEAGQRMHVEQLCDKLGLPVVRLSDAFRADFEHQREVNASQTPERPSDTYAADLLHANLRGAVVGALAMREVLDRYEGVFRLRDESRVEGGVE